MRGVLLEGGSRSEWLKARQAAWERALLPSDVAMTGAEHALRRRAEQD